MTRLLVTTALESTWSSTDEILFLGEWCKMYDRKEQWVNLNYSVAPFHWDDREKLKRDYDYLELLHKRFIVALTDTLNNYHKVNYSLRYWQILLDPWLLTYISVLFDHWECIRALFEDENNNELKTILPNSTEHWKPPYSYSEFASELFFDEWHYRVFSRIIGTYYKDRCMISRMDMPSNNKFGDTLNIIEKVSWRRAIVNYIDYFVGKVKSNYKIVFLESNFNLFSFIKINVLVGQIPRFFNNEFFSDKGRMDNKCEDYEKSSRNGVTINMKVNSLFEEFIFHEIVENIPCVLIEKYKILNDHVSKINIKTKAIVTAGTHWSNPVAKAWMAEQINHHVKLVILEHGGAFPAFKHIFNVEEDISDHRITWVTPYHKKHIKLPPSKLVSLFGWWANKAWRHPFRTSCSIIGFEVTRYVNRVGFSPMSSQYLSAFDSIMMFYKYLNPDIKKCVLVVPYTNLGWNTRKRFQDLLGNDRVFSDMSMSSVHNRSKIIICTYPETTFSEAMASGVPTILFFSKEIYERNEVVRPLLDLLSDSKIVFYNPTEAALHLNSIWDNPFRWWNSSKVIKARNEFKNIALDLDKDWGEKWKTFLESVIEDL